MAEPTDISSIVQPRAGVEPTPTVQPLTGETPPAAEAVAQTPGSLPDELIHVPAMQAIMSGNPPAVSANLKEFSTDPTAKLVAKNKEGLMNAGIGFYRSLSGDLGVIFNQFHIHGNELQAADKAGKLQIVAPPFDVVNQAISGSGMANPVLQNHSVPNSLKSAPMGTPPQSSNSPPMLPPEPNTSKRLANQRVSNLSPGGPTTGAAPGAGRILNQILKPAI